MDYNTLIIIIIIAAIAIAGAIAIVIFLRRRDKRNLKYIEDDFGKNVDYKDIRLDSISYYWYEKLFNKDVNNYIDDITWNDLDMDEVFSRIDACQTSIGEEYLYATLHEPVQDPEKLSKREKLIELFDELPDLRKDIQLILSKMGKSSYTTLASFCYDVESKRLKNLFIYKVLGILPFVFIVLFFVNPLLGLLGFIGSCTINGLIYYYITVAITKEMAAIRYFTVLLWGAGKICDRFSLIDNPIINDLSSSYKIFNKIGGKLSALGQEVVSELDALAEYPRIIMLTNIRHYNKVIDLLEKNTEEFRLLYTSMGEVDLAVNVLSFRKSLPFYSIPQFVTENEISIEEMYHPLVKEPVNNSVSITRNSLVSGSNASGKSTFIKSIAVNAIMAQTINTCTAKSFKTRFALVLTSMAIHDDITVGDSYFISEIKSLKRILDMIPKTNCICIVDEILRGTNTVERIAASASVLEYMAKLDCLCLVATHDIELTTMLEDDYNNYHFSEQITEEGVEFDYKLKEGPTNSRNAIALLDYLGFEKEIVSDATARVKMFEETGYWKHD